MLAAILLVPAHLFRSVERIVFADDAAGEKVGGHLLDDGQEFQIIGVMCRNGAAAQKGSHNVAADGSGGVAVSGMVDAAHDGILEGVPVLGGAVDGDGQRLVAGPASSDGFDGVVVFDIGESQIQRLGNNPFLLLDFLWMCDRHELCRPAYLIAENEKKARAITDKISDDPDGTVDIEKDRPDLIISDIARPNDGIRFARVGKVGLGLGPSLDYMEYLENIMRLPNDEGWKKGRLE